MKIIDKKTLIITLLVVLSVGNGGSSVAQNNIATNLDQLKVAFIYNFSKYFSWPMNQKWLGTQNFNICVNDIDVASGYFNSLTGQTTQSKAVNMIDLSLESVDIGATCHIWFIDQANYLDSKLKLEVLGNSDVLTVSDYPQFASLGGILELVVIDNRVRFRINIEEVQKKQLAASSSLLNLAIKDDQAGTP